MHFCPHHIEYHSRPERQNNPVPIWRQSGLRAMRLYSLSRIEGNRRLPFAGVFAGCICFSSIRSYRENGRQNIRAFALICAEREDYTPWTNALFFPLTAIL